MITSKPVSLSKRESPSFARILLIVMLFTSIQTFAQTFPTGFSRIQVATGISSPTVMAFAPDGRIFVAQQNGVLKVVKNGAVLSTPFISLTVNSSGERGLIGIALDPNFSTNNYIYLYYTHPTGPRNRISRFEANGDVVKANSELVLLELDVLTSATNHNGGAMHFGKDGMLHVAVGENAIPNKAQAMNTYLGKILRLNPANGQGASGNPFSGDAFRDRIWALGLRNPYTFDIQPGTGKILVNDVGQGTWEEINDATTGGKNFGWPSNEGIVSGTSFTNPIYAYGRGSGDGVGCAITGGTFFNPTSTSYPTQYIGKYFFMDYCNKWINYIDPANPQRVAFATNLGSNPLSIDVGIDGNLYYLERGTGALFKIIYTNNTAPAIVTQPANVNVTQGQSATFSVTATGTAPLSYQWQKNGSNISGANSSSYTISTTVPADSGMYRVIVSNIAGSVTSNAAKLAVTAFNNPPVAEIITPVSGALYRAGDTITFSGNATDPEDGTLPASAFAWYADFHHDSHKHDGPAVADGAKSGSFIIPTSGETSDNVWYTLYLIVTDSKGRADTASTEIYPRKSKIKLVTQPAGLQVTLDGQTRNAPDSVLSVEGIERALGVITPQTRNGKTYQFSHWLHGGGASQTISTPVNDVTYTAVYNEVTFTTLTLEAENAALSGAKIAANHAGYTGTGFADYQNSSGDFIEWTANVPSSGTYTLTFSYAMGNNPRNLEVRVNGTVVNSSLSFPKTANWATWSTVSIAATLNSGTNKIKATANGTSGPNVDHLKIAQGGTITAIAPTSKERLFVYPNPATTELVVNVKSQTGDKLKFTLLNQDGKIMREGKAEIKNEGSNEIRLELNGVPTGLYLLKVQNGKKSMSTRVQVIR